MSSSRWFRLASLRGPASEGLPLRRPTGRPPKELVSLLCGRETVKGLAKGVDVAPMLPEDGLSIHKYARGPLLPWLVNPPFVIEGPESRSRPEADGLGRSSFPTNMGKIPDLLSSLGV